MRRHPPRYTLSLHDALPITFIKGGMTLIQTVVWFASLIIIILIAAMFLWVAVKSKEESDYKPIVKKWYKARSVYGVILVLVMFAVTIYTLRELPFNKPSYVESSEIIEVDAESFQFGYELSQDEFSVGDTVKFNVTTRDVTHGFGVYNPDRVLIAQTQAMPEYENSFYITFDEPGTYEVLCLEYCGLGQHIMKTEFVVK